MQTFKGVLLAFPWQSLLLFPSFPLSKVPLRLRAPQLQPHSGCLLASEPASSCLNPMDKLSSPGCTCVCVLGVGEFFLFLSFYKLLSPTSKAHGHLRANVGVIRKPCLEVKWSLPCSDKVSCSSAMLVCSYCCPLLLPCV